VLFIGKIQDDLETRLSLKKTFIHGKFLSTTFCNGKTNENENGSSKHCIAVSNSQALTYNYILGCIFDKGSSNFLSPYPFSALIN